MIDQRIAASLPDPHTTYTERLAARRLALTNEESRSRTLWLWRRVLFVAIAVLIVLAVEKIVAWWWIALPVVAFIALMAMHQRVRQAMARLERAVKFYERGLARLEDRWMGSGETGASFDDKTHPYAEDLDLFGAGSLFELLSTARTHAGEEKLAAWLLAPATVEEVRARQAAVEELRNRLDLREDLALLGAEMRASVQTAGLTAWGTAPPVLTSVVMPIVAAVLGIFAAVAVVMWLGYGYRLWALVALLGEGIFLSRYRAQITQVINAVDRPGRDLALLSEILARLEREQFSTPKLVALRRQLDADEHPPSHQIARLSRWLQILDSTRNQFFAPISFVLLLPAQLSYAIDRWRQRIGNHIPQWLDAVGELEALGALANYAYEHPRDPFPELIESQARLDGRGLGHPLLPENRGVRNDVRLGGELRVLIVSGSNMSGKSTLMRTVGVNVVLALAGAPVRAESLRLSPLNIGASMHILDSLQSGASRFYAEITRLRQVVAMTEGQLPLLFLLDEILSGTNSHDRRIGAESVVKGLAERGAIGLITTHDLALTRITDSLGARAANVHFEDHIEDGQMVFDYKMRPGVVTHSNALALMRAVGLDV